MMARRLWLLALVPVLLGLGGFIWFLRAVQGSAADGGAADAIVVLTGGAERVETGFRLLEEGLAPRLFVSGVHPDSRRPGGTWPCGGFHARQCGGNRRLGQIKGR